MIEEVLTVIAPKRGALLSLLSSGEPRISFATKTVALIGL